MNTWARGTMMPSLVIVGTHPDTVTRSLACGPAPRLAYLTHSGHTLPTKQPAQDVRSQNSTSSYPRRAPHVTWWT